MMRRVETFSKRVFRSAELDRCYDDGTEKPFYTSREVTFRGVRVFFFKYTVFFSTRTFFGSHGTPITRFVQWCVRQMVTSLY